MIPVSRKGLCFLQTLLVLVLAAMPFAAAPATIASLAVAVPVVFLVEVLAYFVLSLVFHSRMQLTTAAAVSVAGAVLRLFACMVAFALHAMIFVTGDAATQGSLLALAYGHPFATAVQVAFVLLGMANMLSVVAPRVLSPEVLERLGEASAALPGPSLGGPAAAGSHLSSPSGQFIQVFSFDELSAVVRKTPGLEGFAVYSNEGLVVWRDMPIRLDLDALVARLVSGAAGLGKIASGAGLGGLQRLLLESGQHSLYTAPIGENFGLLLVGKPSSSGSDLHGRAAVVVSTVREFLRWKYPSLPARTPSVREL